MLYIGHECDNDKQHYRIATMINYSSAMADSIIAKNINWKNYLKLASLLLYIGHECDNDKQHYRIATMINYSSAMADSIIAKNIKLTDHWGYEYGLTLEGIYEVYKATGERKYLDFIIKTMDTFINQDGTINGYRLDEYNIDHLNNGKMVLKLYDETHEERYKNIKTMDTFINQDGTINGYRLDEYNIDHLNNGKMVLKLYDETHEERYKKAAELLYSQTKTHPRTSEGVFWHKMIYPHQIWCDGLYMGAAFMASYVAHFGQESDFDDIVIQFTKSYPHLVDSTTGLLYHAYDESKSMFWANKETGLSEHFWGRAMGWYVMALADVLEYLPKTHQGYVELSEILNKCLKALLKVQDSKAHVWYQILNLANEPQNYLEASASCMITASLFKAMRLGVLENEFMEHAKNAYAGLITQFIAQTKDGHYNLNKICYVAGLGGAGGIARDGTFAYYISEPIISNEPKGLGPFLFASTEFERL